MSPSVQADSLAISTHLSLIDKPRMITPLWREMLEGTRPAPQA
jgi:hypothetical protein